MAKRRKRNNRKWNEYMKKALKEPVSKLELCQKLKIPNAEYFRSYVKRTSKDKYRVYTFQTGYFKIATVENEFKVVESRLTNLASGMLRSRNCNRERMFDMLQIVGEERKKLITNDPLYKMFKKEVDRIGDTNKLTYKKYTYEQAEPAQAFQ